MPRACFSTLPALAVLLAAGCATGPSSQASLARTANIYTASPGARSSSVLSASEIGATTDVTAYEVVQHLRPQFLAQRRGITPGDPYDGRAVVYLDGIRLGGIDELRSLAASMVGEVRYLSPVAAGGRFGRYHPGGVIAIESRR